MNIEHLLPADFSGCALCREEDALPFERAYGFANIPDRIPNRVDTRFGTASAGKVFVAVGILQLIERGELSFASTIGELLPIDWKAVDRDITVRELLCHTSGIPDYFDESVMDEYEELWRDFPNYRIRRNGDLFPLFIGKPMMYPRGERFQYNNTGFVVLAQIIEQVTGTPFDRWLEKNVFLPCGMTRTGYYELDRLPEGCANSYIFDGGEPRTNIFCIDAKGTGAGGAFTTVGDVARFWGALLSFELLSPAMTNDMLTVHARGDGESYGLGIWLAETSRGIIPYFEGCDPGVSFISGYDRDAGRLLVLVSNTGHDVWSVWRRVMLGETH